MMRIQLPESLKSQTFTTWVCCAYLFFAHVPRTTAVVNSLIGLMLLSMVVLLMRRQLALNLKSGMVRAFAAFVIVVMLGAALSPYREESLTPLRRDVLPMILVFVLLAGQKRVAQHNQQRQVALLAAWSIIGAFMCRTFLAVSDWLQQGVQNDVYSINRAAARFFDFFAIDATLMMPIAVAAILYLVKNRGVRALLLCSIAVAWLLIIVSGVRAAVVALGLVTLLQLLPWIWRHKLSALLGIAVLAVGLVASSPERLARISDRYATIVSADTYVGKEAGYSSFYERLSIWHGTLEMVAERPLLGYGLGWQKIYDVAYQDGYIERWTNSDQLIDRAVANYFRPLKKGEANPHNLLVQMLFETGIAGLFTYSLMLLVLLWRALRLLRQKTKEPAEQWFAAGTLAYMTSYLLVNTMNGLWLGAGATLMLLAVSELLSDRRASRA